jgi:hypothetical protein
MRKKSIAFLLGALLIGGCGSTETGEPTSQRNEQKEIPEVRKEPRKVPVEFPLETHNYDFFQNSNAYGFMTVWMAESADYPSLVTFEAEDGFLSHSMQEMADAPSVMKSSPEGPKSPFSNLDFPCNRKTIFAKRVR